MIERINKNKEKINANIDSLIIDINGNSEMLVYNPTGLHELRSCSKMFVAFAIGIAMDKNMEIHGERLSLNTKIYPVLKEAADITNKGNLKNIKQWTVRTLLTHTAGYETQMLSERCIKDLDKDNLFEYALNYDMPFNVDERYAYNNAEPFILSVFFQEAFGVKLSDFVNENIFMKMQIEDYKWLDYGIYCAGGTGLYLKHEDFHKVCKLFLNEGKYNDIEIVSSEWLDEMCKLQIETPNYYKPERLFPKEGAGYFTFISRDGYIFRDGSNGQYMILNRDKRLLITIVSTEKDSSFVTEIFRGIL